MVTTRKRGIAALAWARERGRQDGRDGVPAAYNPYRDKKDPRLERCWEEGRQETAAERTGR
jgi:hypothetical protein